MSCLDITDGLLSLRLREFCQLLASFSHDRVPLTLFTRACTDLPTWSASGERVRRLREDALVPEYLRALFKSGDLLSEDLRVAIEKGVISLEGHGTVRFLVLDRRHREEVQAQTPTSIRLRLSFDILSLVIHAFPERYAELLWMEIENELREVAESTYMTVLAVMKGADIMLYLSSKPRNLQSRYLQYLLHFLLRMPNSSTPTAPNWMSSLIADIMQLLIASNPAFGQETSYLNLLITINRTLDLSRANIGSESDVLEQLRRLDSQEDERSNAAVGFALISLSPKFEAPQLTDLFEDLVVSWRPLSERNPSTLETIVSAKLSGIVSFPMSSSRPWQGLDIEAKIIVAFEMGRNRNLQGAQAILEQGLEEVEQKYGAKSPEIFITTAELLHCYNVLGVKEGERNISQMVLSRLCDSRCPAVFGYEFLLIQNVDCLLGLGKYSEAEEWMEKVLKDSSISPPTTSMVALRMLKARRRQKKAWLDDCTPNCMKFLVKSFPGLSNSLRFEVVDEILGSIYLVDMKDREQMRHAAEIIADLRDRMTELPRAWTSHYPVLESHMQCLDRYSRAFFRRIGLCKKAEKNTVGSDAVHSAAAPLQTTTTPISVETPSTSWEGLLRTTSRKLEWIMLWPLGFGKQMSALGWAGVGPIDMDWITSRWQDMAVELLLGKQPASRLMKRATVDRRGSIILRPIATEYAGKCEVESTTLNAEYSALMPARAALALRTSKPEKLRYETAHHLRKWQYSDHGEFDFMSVKFGRRAQARKELSADEKDVYASCAFRVLYAKITFVLRRVRRL